MNNLRELAKQKTNQFRKERGIISCSASEENEMISILKEVYSIAVVIRRHSGNVQIKYGGKKYYE